MENIINDIETTSLKNLVEKYKIEHVYFIGYITLLTKLLYTENGTYNPYNLNVDKFKDDKVNDIMYIISMFDGFNNQNQLKSLYQTIQYHYINVYGNDKDDSVIVDEQFWLQRIFNLVYFICKYTNFKFSEFLQIVYILTGMDAYRKWNKNIEIMNKAEEFVDYLINNLPDVKFGTIL